jgi:hypothetical protein
MLNFSLTKFKWSSDDRNHQLDSVGSPYSWSRINGLYWSELISQMKLISLQMVTSINKICYCGILKIFTKWKKYLSILPASPCGMHFYLQDLSSERLTMWSPYRMSCYWKECGKMSVDCQIVHMCVFYCLTWTPSTYCNLSSSELNKLWDNVFCLVDTWNTVPRCFS